MSLGALPVFALRKGDNMILAFDVGNTNIVMGVIDEEKTYFLTRFATDPGKTQVEYAVLVKNILEIRGIDIAKIDGGIISSVVPPLNNILKEVISLLTGHKALIVGPGLKSGLNIAVGDPAELGADLVVGAVAAIAKYEAPMLIMDLGTATTISAIGKKKEFLGVIIFPGVKISFDALVGRTALLSSISYDEPAHVIGTTTTDSMQSGLIYGNAAMLDGLIDRCEEEMGEVKTIIATGGISSRIVPHCKHDIVFDDDLLIDGLRIIYYKNAKTAKKK